MNIPMIVWTNDKYKDLWKPFLGRIHKWIPNANIIFATDKHTDQLKNYVIYDEETNMFSDELVRIANDIEQDQFILLQDDFILYDKPNLHRIEKIIEFLEQSEYGFVRMIRSGEPVLNPINAQCLYTAQKPFSFQPTIWKKKYFCELLNQYRQPQFFTIENYIGAHCTNPNGLFYYDNEPWRGTQHCDSNIFPYIATAIHGGVWNTKYYPAEIADMCNEYNIDINIRGTNENTQS